MKTFNPLELEPKEVYFLMTQTVIPRPIAWISSVSISGIGNLAPFSYFNAVCSDPPLLMVSFTGSQKKGLKDTLTNILDTMEFCVNIPSFKHFEKVVDSAAEYDFGINEAEILNIDLEPCASIKPPRVKDAAVSFECVLETSITFGNPKKSGATVVFGKVKCIHISEDCFMEGKIDPQKIDPLCRLGRTFYSKLENVYSRKIPEV
ncbi:MAG: flavin reductase family protein [Deltaproteobacteria bacterium]|nr:flavin reductase family protein [Deltaproteobacteria bacterium]MCX7953287.1 flavin reductase family protein [Deltaproteobacteria bacterium]